MNLFSRGKQWTKRIGRDWHKLFLRAVLAGLFLAMPSFTQAAEGPVIRVGYDISGSMIYSDENGEYRGYNMEILYEIAKYTGWKYELVPFSKWADAVKAVEDGSIDLLPTVLKAPEREGNVLFSDRRMGIVHVALVVPEDNRQHFYGAWDSLQGTRIGVRENTVDSADFFIWARQQNLQYTRVEYDDRQDLLRGLDDGTIDAAALSYIGSAKKYRAVAEFASQDMYFAVAPTRPAVLADLNMAMGRIAIMNPQFYSNLLTKYLESNAVGNPVFSREEQQFIDSDTSVRVALIRNAAPFSSWKEGKFSGIIPDVLQRVAELSGLSFAFLPVDSQEEAIQAVHEGRADMVGRLANNVFFARRYDLRLTTPYMYMPMMQVRHKNTDTVRTVAVQGIAQLDQVQANKKYSENIQMQVYPDVQQCFDALTAGTVDAMYCDQVTANYFMNTHRYSEYRMDILQPFSYDLTFGVDGGTAGVLPSILDKSIRCITAAEVDEIVMQNRIQEPLTMGNILARLPGQYLAGFILLLMVILLFLAYASLNLWRKRGIEKRMGMVRERNQQMEADLALVKRVNEVKEKFFARIDEDMQRPLEQLATLSAQAAAAGSAVEPAALQELAAGSRILRDRMGELLLLDHLERGKVRLQWTTVDSLSFLRQLTAEIRQRAAEKNIVFRMDLSGLEQRNILVDARHTPEVFQRLLDNAVKFTSPGGMVSFNVESFMSPRGRFVLWCVIKDTGRGMSREFLPKACEVFSQEKRAAAAGGIGVGLTIVQSLVSLMGGELELRSRENEGTEVRLELYFDLEREPESGDTPHSSD